MRPNPMAIRPVILAGGAGTRLWPLSTTRSPKQFHALGTAHPLLTETALRVQGEGFLSPVIVGNIHHAGRITECLAAGGIAPDCMILEPESRNTAPAIAVAALAVEDPDAIIAALPADHRVDDASGFRACLRRAANAATSDQIVTLGVRPRGAETGFGYIRASTALSEGVLKVEGFVEKPDAQTAASYVASGDYFWNSGIFVFRAGAMVDSFARLRPETLAAAREALRLGDRSAKVIRLDAGAFGRTHARSIDHEIMERITNAAMVPADFGWSDLGSANALWEAMPKDSAGNASGGGGESVFVEARENLIHTNGPAVALVGVEGLAVIATPEGIVVIPKSRAQDIKAVVEELRRRGRADLV